MKQYLESINSLQESLKLATMSQGQSFMTYAPQKQPRPKSRHRHRSHDSDSSEESDEDYDPDDDDEEDSKMDQDEDGKDGSGDGNDNQDNTAQDLSQTAANGGLPVFGGPPIANGSLAPIDDG